MKKLLCGTYKTTENGKAVRNGLVIETISPLLGNRKTVAGGYIVTGTMHNIHFDHGLWKTLSNTFAFTIEPPPNPKLHPLPQWTTYMAHLVDTDPFSTDPVTILVGTFTFYNMAGVPEPTVNSWQAFCQGIG